MPDLKMAVMGRIHEISWKKRTQMPEENSVDPQGSVEIFSRLAVATGQP